MCCLVGGIQCTVLGGGGGWTRLLAQRVLWSLGLGNIQGLCRCPSPKVRIPGLYPGLTGLALGGAVQYLLESQPLRLVCLRIRCTLACVQLQKPFHSCLSTQPGGLSCSLSFSGGIHSIGWAQSSFRFSERRSGKPKPTFGLTYTSDSRYWHLFSQ